VLDRAAYAAARPRYERQVIDDKRLRRVAIGPNMTLLFENRLACWWQVQEMVRVEGMTDPAAIQHELDTYNAILPEDVRAFSWRNSFADFLWVLQLEKNMMMFMMLFVVLVAAFLTMSLLLVLVMKKTREIGLLGALGASRRQIALCFCLQGVVVGVVGTLGGLVLGFTFLHFRNDVVHAITRFTGGQQLLAQFYQFQELPAHLEMRDLIVIIVSALVLSTLAGIIPAVMAARLKPVEALRSE
jgi:lipoprotein-releasing system permease protein